MASQFVFDAIGTKWTIDIESPLTEEEAKQLFPRIAERIDLFDKAYSRFRDDSLVTEISRAAGRYMLPDDAPLMMDAYRKMYDVTGGLVTPLIGQVLVDAGYDAQYSLVQQNPLVEPPAWDDVMAYEHPHLDVRTPVLLDFGAAGKGYLIDIIGNLLKAEGIDSFCIDAGGDMLQQNANGAPLVVGLEHPLDATKIIGTVSILNQSLCGSAGNRRVWGEFHHIIDPKTLTSPRRILAVWVIAESTLIADALTTGLFFVPPAKLEEHFSFEYFILNADLSFEKSEGFKAEIFS